MEESKNNSTPNNAESLKMAQSIRDYHHKALWEEEKHFTWLLSIIFSANVIILSTDKILLPDKILIIIGISTIGIIISLIGFKVLRNESNNFQVAFHNFIKEYNQYFTSNKQKEVSIESQNKNIVSLVYNGIKGKATTRDAFQIVVILFGSIFLLCVIASLFVGIKYVW